MTKLRTRSDETRVNGAEHSVLKPESWTRGVDFGMLAKGTIFPQTVAADKWHSDFTPSEQCALHSFQVHYVIKRFKFTNEKNISIRVSGLC